MAKKWLDSVENKTEEAMFVTDRQTHTQRQTESTTKNNRLLG